MASFGFHDNVYCHLSASLCAGFLAVAAGSPFDVIKSRAMGAPPLLGVHGRNQAVAASQCPQSGAPYCPWLEASKPSPALTCCVLPCLGPLQRCLPPAATKGWGT